jgi:hypothetical protein
MARTVSPVSALNLPVTNCLGLNLRFVNLFQKLHFIAAACDEEKGHRIKEFAERVIIRNNSKDNRIAVN